MTQKIFVSLPFTSDESTIRERQESLLDKVQSMMHLGNTQLLDSFITLNDKQLAKYESKSAAYLGLSIEILAKADIAIFDYLCKSYRGCLTELQVCRRYGIPHVVFTDEILNKAQYWKPLLDEDTNEILDWRVHIISEIPFASASELSNEIDICE